MRHPRKTLNDKHFMDKFLNHLDVFFFKMARPIDLVDNTHTVYIYMLVFEYLSIIYI